MAYRFVDHTGDTAVELTADTGAVLLEDAARALSAIIVDVDESPLESRLERSVAIDAEDGEALLVDFLNELVFLFDTERFLPTSLEIDRLSLDPPARLRATVSGDTFDPERHVFLTEVKAATFHEVKIRRSAAGLSTTIVFDL